VHRDLKPANVMIGRFDEVYVVDWGIAVSLVDDGRLPFAGNNPAFRLFGLRQSLLATERDEAIQLGL